MSTLQGNQKVVFLGLGHSGKSSIKSVVFEGKTPEDVKNYAATINYTRSTKGFLDSAFQIFDCGGQENFISVFVGDQAEFIFSDVLVLIWVVDVSNMDQVSTSKFYFDHALKRLNQYSPEAEVFVFFHKNDLIMPNLRKQVLDTMEQYFVSPYDNKITYRATSIFDQSIYLAIGEVIRTLMLKSTRAQTVSEAIREFLKQNVELEGISIYTAEEGLPVFEEGEMAEQIIVPANLCLTTNERIQNEFSVSNVFKTTLETNDYIFVFQHLKTTQELLLSGIARKVSPLQYVMVKMEQLAAIVKDLL